MVDDALSESCVLIGGNNTTERVADKRHRHAENRQQKNRIHKAAKRRRYIPSKHANKRHTAYTSTSSRTAVARLYRHSSAHEPR